MHSSRTESAWCMEETELCSYETELSSFKDRIVPSLGPKVPVDRKRHKESWDRIEPTGDRIVLTGNHDGLRTARMAPGNRKQIDNFRDLMTHFSH